MPEIEQVSYPTLPTQPFRLDVPLHALLKDGARRPAPRPLPQAQVLPDPVFPLHPELLHEIDAADIAAHEQVVRNGRRHWGPAKILHTMNGWMRAQLAMNMLRPG